VRTLLNLWAVANVIGVSAALDVTRLGISAVRGATDVAESLVDGFEVSWRPSVHAVLMESYR
jgi:hypothetical protein